MRYAKRPCHLLRAREERFTFYGSEKLSSLIWGRAVLTARRSDRATSGYWKVQPWLGENLIEEHIAPSELAEQYAKVIRIRIAGLKDRQLKIVPISIHELTYPTDRPYDPRD